MNKAKILENKTLTHDVFELIIETAEQFKFQAGQFITIKIADNQQKPCFRAYSIFSAPHDKTLQLVVKIIPNGRGSNWLASLKPDMEIEFLGPSGEFTFKTPQTKTALFIATGTGIAPFRSIIEDELLNKKNEQPLHLIWGLRYIKDIFYKEHFEKLAKKFENFTFDLTLSQPEDPAWQGHTGRVTTFLENLEIAPDPAPAPNPDLPPAPAPSQTQAYLCGLKAMIDSVTEILKTKGFPEEAIHCEKYD